MRFASERLDLPDALQVVHEQGVHGAGRLALRAIASVRRDSVPDGASGQQRNGRKRHQRQHGIVMNHEGEHTNDAEKGDGPLLRAVDQHAFDGVDVFEHAGHQIAGSTVVEIVDRQPLEPRINIAAHVVDHILLEFIVDADAQAVEQVPQQERGEQSEHDRREQRGLFFANHPVDHQPDQLRVGEREGQRQDGAADVGDRHPFVGPKINRDAADNFPGRAGPGGERRVGAGCKVAVTGHATKACGFISTFLSPWPVSSPEIYGENPSRRRPVWWVDRN